MPADVADAAGIDVALDRFQLADHFQRADLRRAADRAGRERGTQHVGIAQPRLQLPGDFADDVHDVAVAFDHELLAHFHGTGLRDAASIVAAEVDQHQVLGAFLRVGQQLSFQRQVLLDGGTARTGAGNRPHSDFAILQTHQDFRRGTDHLQVADIEEIHVRRGIQRAQRAIHIHRARLERHAQALAEHHLEDVAGTDVFLAALDRIDEALAGEPGDEIGLVQHVAVERRRIAGTRCTQLRRQGIQARLGLFEGTVDARVGVHDQV